MTMVFAAVCALPQCILRGYPFMRASLCLIIPVARESEHRLVISSSS